MFSKIIEWFKKLLKQNNTGNLNIALDDKTVSEIENWARMYEDNAKWLNKDVKSAGIASAVAQEIARLVTLELESEITGSKRADYLNKCYQEVLKNIRTQTEYAAALGGIFIKPYIYNNDIKIEFIQADDCIPIAFDATGEITGVCFISQLVKNGRIYTRLEENRYENGKCIIKNKAYESKTKEQLGYEVELSSIEEWAEIVPEAEIKNISMPLFSYFKMPQANNKNRKSKLGCSVYAKAVDLIKQADEQYSRILWEYEASEMAIDASESLFKKDANGNSILPRGKERLFRSYDIHGGINEKGLIQEYAPTIRDESLFNGLNKLLQKIEFACGLAYGTLSDVQVEAKTATEVITSKQRSYALVADIQQSLQNALERLVEIMDILATLYKLAPAGNYEITFNFDDSLVVDVQQKNSMTLQEVTAGIIKKEVYIMQRYGVTEEEALKMMPDAINDDLEE